MSAVAIPTEGDWVELSRRTKGKQGRLFKKHILNKGALVHPTTGAKVKIDDQFFNTMLTNFQNGICDIVQVPLADADNRHTEDPTKNIGEVVGLEESGGKIYAVIDARDETAADKLGKTLLGASAFLHLDYTDSNTGEKVGPTLLHVCVTNRPYVTGLEEYKEVIAASADNQGEIIMMTYEDGNAMPTKEELIAALKEDHGIDVEALQSMASAAVDTAKLTSDIVDALKPVVSGDTVKLSSSEVTLGDAVGAVRELATSHQALNESHVALTAQVTKLTHESAEREVAGHVKAGRILPKQEKAMVELLLSAPATYAALLPEKPIVAMNTEVGVDPSRTGDAQKSDIQAQINHYVDMLPKRS